MKGPIDPRYLPPQTVGMNRRMFLQVTSLAGAGFLVGCGESESPPDVAKYLKPAPADADLNVFVHIQADDSVTVVIKHLDKGQGVTTGLTTIVAEELDADWAQMRWEFAPANARLYNNLYWGSAQGTGGSSSIANSWMQLRNAAAGARYMLVQSAANLSPEYLDKGPILVSESQIDLLVLDRLEAVAVEDLRIDSRTLYPAESGHLACGDSPTWLWQCRHSIPSPPTWSLWLNRMGCNGS